MAEILTKCDEEYLATIYASIKRGRALLMSISLLAAWLVAGTLIDLVRWQDVRTPASYAIVESMDEKLIDLPLKISEDNLRPIEKVAFDRIIARECDSGGSDSEDLLTVYYSCTTLAKDKEAATATDSPDESPHATDIHTCGNSIRKTDSLFVIYPVKKTFGEIVSWCGHYLDFILNQWDSASINRVQMILSRAQTTPYILPNDIINRPQIDVPVVGLRISLDDINIVGSIILLLAMIWFRFAHEQVHENINVFRRKYCRYSPKRTFFESWLPMQFFFIQRLNNHNSPNNDGSTRTTVKEGVSVHFLFFIPYLTVLFSLLDSIHSIIWQTVGYSHISDTKYVPFWMNNLLGGPVAGILFLRWFILILIAGLLVRIAMISWRKMHCINAGANWDVNQSLPSLPRCEKKRMWMGFIILTLAPIFVMAWWTFARLLDLNKSIDTFGWTYAVSPVGTAIVIAAVLTAGISLRMLWSRFVLRDRQ